MQTKPFHCWKAQTLSQIVGNKYIDVMNDEKYFYPIDFNSEMNQYASSYFR